MASAASAQVLSPVIAGGPHDLSSGSAAAQHERRSTARPACSATRRTAAPTSIPLWNRSNPTGTTYQLYTSSTSDVTTTGAVIAASVSGACMSCHDGTMAMDVLLNVNGLPFTPGRRLHRQAHREGHLRQSPAAAPTT